MAGPCSLRCMCPSMPPSMGTGMYGGSRVSHERMLSSSELLRVSSLPLKSNVQP